MRMCIDYKALYKKTIKNLYHIPYIDELIDDLNDVVYFSKIDLRSRYHQIRMRRKMWKRPLSDVTMGTLNFLLYHLALLMHQKHSNLV